MSWSVSFVYRITMVFRREEPLEIKVEMYNTNEKGLGMELKRIPGSLSHQSSIS